LEIITNKDLTTAASKKNPGTTSDSVILKLAAFGG
jgi:hypothetical protein